MKKPGNRNRNEKTGQFVPSRTAEDLAAGVGILDDVLDLKRELKDMRNMFVKNMRGTLTSAKIGPDGLQIKNEDGTTKQFPYELTQPKVAALTKYIEILMDKLISNAKVAESSGSTAIDVVIKPPKMLKDDK